MSTMSRAGQIAYVNEERHCIEVNERLLPVSIRYQAPELISLLNEKFTNPPVNRTTRRQIEREVSSWAKRQLRLGYVHVDAEGKLELRPHQFPQSLQEHLPELVAAINRVFGRSDTSEITRRRMSRFIEGWTDAKLQVISEQSGEDDPADPNTMINTTEEDQHV